MSRLPLMKLPGEADIDELLIASVVDRINGTVQKKGLETARALGLIVLDAFFGGDPANFRSCEKKHVSFRRLASRDDLDVSHVTLWTSVAVVEQLQQLPEDIGRNLSFSHHRVLLGVRDLDMKRALAAEALEEGLSRRALVERVRARRLTAGEPSRGGRPPQPAFIKAIKRLSAAADTAASDLPTPETVKKWGPERSRDALAEARRRLGDLQRVVTALAEAVEAVDRDSERG